MAPFAVTDDIPAEYGQILQAPLEGNDRTDVDINYWGGLASLDFSGDQVEVGVAQVGQRDYLLSVLERHIKCAEVNMPVRSDFLVPLALSDQGLEHDPHLVVARVRVGQALVIMPGVWHSPAYPISRVGVYWVFLRKGSGIDDLEKVRLPTAVRLSAR